MSEIVLIDMNNLAMRLFFTPEVGSDKTPNYDYWKYLMFMNMLGFVRAQGGEAKEVVVAIDGSNYWRKRLYPQYKGDRKKRRDDSGVDFKQLFQELESFLNAAAMALPFKFVKVDEAEADDVIGTIALLEPRRQSVVVLSADEDYAQLYKRGYVQIYDPMHKRWVVCEDTDRWLMERVLCGQRKDNIFNVLTSQYWGDPEKCPASIDADGKVKRKPPLGEKKAQSIIDGGVSKWLESQPDWVCKRFDQNALLIDLRSIPDDVRMKILTCVAEYKLPSSTRLAPFMKAQNWPSLASPDAIQLVHEILDPLYNA